MTQWFPIQEILPVVLAAASAHNGQTRVGTSEAYIQHPLRVAIKASKLDMPLACVYAALLHDVIEDCGDKGSDVFNDVCLMMAPSVEADVRRLVRLLTKPAERLTNEQYFQYYYKIAEDHEASTLKLIDRSDNLDEMGRILAAGPSVLINVHGGARGWAANYLEKSRRWMPSIMPRAKKEAIDGYHKSFACLDEALLAASRQ